MNAWFQMKEQHPIIGDVKGKGFLLGIELVKDKKTKEPFDEAGKLVYQKHSAKVWHGYRPDIYCGCHLLL